MTRALATAAALAALALGVSACDLPELCSTPGSGDPPGCVDLNRSPQGDAFVVPSGEFGGLQIVGQTVKFDVIALDPDGDALFVEWDFDRDGEFDRSGYYDTPRLGHRIYRTAGRKQVTVRVSDFPGLPGGEGQFTDTIDVRVFSREEIENDRPPVANFTIAPNPARSQEVIRFDAAGSHDPDPETNITSYDWRIESAEGYLHERTTPASIYEHAVPFPGQYTVTLDVHSEGWLSSPFRETQQRLIVVDSTSPIAELEAEPNPAFVEQTVRFDASASTDPDGDIASYAFDLDGNGSFETETGGPVASRMYFQPGVVQASVRVTDAQGNVDVESVDVHVESTGDRAPREPTLRRRAELELPFSALIEDGRLTGRLVNPPGPASRLEAAARRLLRSGIDSRLKTETNGSGVAETKGIAVARGEGRMSVCLRLALAAPPGQPATGGLRILGGTGPGRKLRGRATFRAAAAPVGEIEVVGGLELRRGKARELPRRCGRLAP